MTQVRKAAPKGRRKSWSGMRAWGLGVVVFLLVVLVPLGFFAEAHWPYRYRNVKPLLENVFASQITVTKYSRTYFPRPGFAADGMTLTRKGADQGMPPIGTAQHVLVQGGWLDLLMLREHVELVDVTGMHAVIPAAGSDARKKEFPAGSSADFAGPDTSIGKLVLHDAVLEIQRADEGPLVFPIHKMVLHDVAKGQAVRYELDMINAMPSGHILAHGSFGPLLPHNLGDTQLSGDFTFDEVQLKDIGTLRGVLNASGHFDKTLSSIHCKAHSDTPAFAVADGRPIHVSSDVHCTINGLNGDTILNEVDLRMGSTPVTLRGSVAGEPKVTKLSVDVARGRVQDLLQPFSEKKPPVTGPVMLRAKAQILAAPRGTKFLERLRMEGSFDIPSEKLTNKQTEQSLSEFSGREQGAKGDEDEADALSSLRGSATIRDGVVSSQSLAFAVAGANAEFHGTYSLKNKQVNMAGTLRTEKDLSHATTGFKSFLLKPISPFFKRKDAGAVVPVTITGGPGSYHIGADLFGKKK